MTDPLSAEVRSVSSLEMSWVDGRIGARFKSDDSAV